MKSIKQLISPTVSKKTLIKTHIPNKSYVLCGEEKTRPSTANNYCTFAIGNFSNAKPQDLFLLFKYVAYKMYKV